VIRYLNANFEMIIFEELEVANQYVESRW